HVRAYEEVSRPTAAGAYRETPGRRSPWVWALPALALIALAAFLLSRRNEAPREAAIDTTRPAQTAPNREARPAPDVPRVIPPGGAAGLGAFVEKSLPNNVTLRIPAEGVERRLVEYIEDPNQAPSKETWFSFDRVEFEPDSATLLPRSMEQLQN